MANILQITFSNGFSFNKLLTVFLSVCLCLSHLFHYAPFMVSSWNYQWNYMSYYQWQKWFLCKSSRSEVKGQGYKIQSRRFGIITPVWFHIWWWNDAQSLISFRSGALFSRSSVKFQGHTAKKSSILTQIGRLRTVSPVWIHRWLWNDAWRLK